MSRTVDYLFNAGIALLDLVQGVGICQGLLTLDVQRLLTRYEVIDGHWFDVTAGTAVHFPEHLRDVRGRAPLD